LDLKNLGQGPDIEGLVQALKLGEVTAIGQSMANQLESVTLPLYLKVKEIKQDLSNLGLFPLLCGSGASVFGLAESFAEASKAKEILEKKWPIVIQAFTVT
jgi:4-diphosphocytidyl-2-C-methyl-D-erythritol kinase